MMPVVVPFIPTSSQRPNSNDSHTVINKKIVYSDTVLPIKDLGSNIKISSISNVSEYSFETCLKRIFESNPDVTFNTIQYSRKDKKIYFYTDKEISTKEWEERNLKTYKPITTSKEILEEIKEILVSKENTDSDCISLYDVSKLVKKMNLKYERTKKKYEEYFNRILKQKYGKSCYCCVFDFKYKNNELLIGVHDIKNEYLSIDDFEKEYIIFSKRNGDLFIKKTEEYKYPSLSDILHDEKLQDVLFLLGDKLSELYEEFLKYSDFINQEVARKTSINSSFLIDIRKYGIFIHNDQYNMFSDFSLSYNSYQDEYNYKCNSNNIISATKGNEDELFKRIYVRIDDCPEWSRETLYKIRQDQLEEIRKAEEERILSKQRLEEERKIQEEQERIREEQERIKELKKQKRLERIRKIFPLKNK